MNPSPTEFVTGYIEMNNMNDGSGSLLDASLTRFSGTMCTGTNIPSTRWYIRSPLRVVWAVVAILEMVTDQSRFSQGQTN